LFIIGNAHRMKHIISLFLFLFFLLVAGPAGAKTQVPVTPSPSWTKPLTANLNDRVKTQDVSDGYFFLLDDRQVHTAKREFFVHQVRKIISDEGVQSGSDLSLQYDPSYQQLSFHYVRITRNGTVMDRTRETDFKVIQPERGLTSYIFDGNYTAVAFLNDIRNGDIIEYAYTIKGDNPVFEGRFSRFIYLESTSPLSMVSFRLVVPKEKQLQIKNDRITIQPVVTDAEGFLEYVWQQEQGKVLKIPDRIPDWYDAYSSVQVTEYRNWQELQQWAARQFRNPDPVSAGILALAASIRTEHPDQEDQLVAALRFVQDEVRYTGIETGEYSHKPLSPNKVFEMRYGDCKGKSVLLCALLKEAGITAFPALVNSYYRGRIADLLPAPDDFNHCIVKVIFRGKTYWFDPTMSNQKGLLGQIYCPDYGKALVINDGSEGLSDVQPFHAGRTHAEEVFTLKDSTGPGYLVVYTDYFGSDADDFRSELASAGISALETNYLKFYGSNYPEIEFIDSLTVTDDPVENTIHTVEKYKITNIWELLDSASRKISVNFYAELLRSKLYKPSALVRTMPLALAFPVDYNQVIKVILWDRWSITNDDFNVKNKWSEFIHRSYLSGDTIVLEYSLKALTDHVLPKDMAAYDKGINKIIDNTGYSVSWDPSALQEGGRINFLLIIVTVLSLLLFLIVARKVYRISLAPRQFSETQPLGGWLVLVLIGLVVTPIRIILHLVNNDYFDQEVWTALTTPASDSYHPLWSTMLTFELSGNLLTLCLALFCLFLMVKKRDLFPKVMVVYLLSNFVFVLCDYLLAKQIPMITESVELNDTTREIFRSFVASAIWIPYMLVSKRVAETFTLPYTRKDANFQAEDLPSLESAGQGAAE